MAQEIKIKVDMHSEKCRKDVMKIVTKLSGVNQVSVDLKKEMVVVVGNVDPVSVAKSLRKKRKVAEIVSVGPHKKKDKDEYIGFPMMCYNNYPYYDGYGPVVSGYPPTRYVGGCHIV